MIAIQTPLLRHVTALADARLATDLRRTGETIGRRPRMVMIMNAVCCWLNPGSSWHGDRTAADAAGEWTAELASGQGADGLFSIGGNTASAPDTGFVINDAATTVLLLQESDALPELQRAVGSIIDAAAPGLIAGGIHTPNHRWEIAAALVRTDAVRSAPAARARAEQWLAEGVDIDSDGLYSERSANYAAYVSNPSLLALAELLDRRDLADAVHRNLHAHLDLTGPDGLVETVFSRRQDQKLPGLDLGLFLLHYRSFAGSCASCADTYRQLVDRELAADHPIADPTVILAYLLFDQHPEPVRLRGSGGQPRSRIFSSARVAAVHDRRSMITINAGSDVPSAGRVASGLACNPTLLRWRFAELALDSVRLSRNFFGLGPFRAERLDCRGGGRLALRETVSAGYYQPLPNELCDDHGNYALQYEGRFAAQMAFADRPCTDLILSTDIEIGVQPDKITIIVRTDGPPTAQCLEFGFRPGGTMINAEEFDDGRWLISPGIAYQQGNTSIAIDSNAPKSEPDRAFYQPGEAYDFLGGTDAVAGPRIYLPFDAPGEVEVTLTTTDQRL